MAKNVDVHGTNIPSLNTNKQVFYELTREEAFQLAVSLMASLGNVSHKDIPVLSVLDRGVVAERIFFVVD